jgi:hypothetical protein
MVETCAPQKVDPKPDSAVETRVENRCTIPEHGAIPWLDWYPDSLGRCRRYATSHILGCLGPGIPDPPLDWREVGPYGHRIPAGHEMAKTPLLGGLHHEYRLRPVA